MDNQTAKPKDESLVKLKAAASRLNKALTATILTWPNTDRCWIDQLNDEPTLALRQHRLENKLDELDT